MRTQQHAINNRPIKRFESFHRSLQGYMILGTIELILAYIFASIAIDTASMWAYLAAIILTLGVIFNFANAIMTLIGKKGSDRAKR